MNQEQNDLQKLDDDNTPASNSSQDGDSNGDTSPQGIAVDTSALYFGDSSLQTKSEFDSDKKSDHAAEDNKVTASDDVDDAESNSDGAAGTDRAGIAKRKDYGDTELNKGLESQAMDEEGTNL